MDIEELTLILIFLTNLIGTLLTFLGISDDVTIM